MAPTRSKGRRRPFGAKYAAILQALYHLDKSQRDALLRKADTKLIRHICECALNVLHGNVPLKPVHKKRLRKHAHILRKLSNPGGHLARKKKLIVQSGGFLPALLAPIIGTVLASLIAK